MVRKIDRANLPFSSKNSDTLLRKYGKSGRTVLLALSWFAPKLRAGTCSWRVMMSSGHCLQELRPELVCDVWWWFRPDVVPKVLRQFGLELWRKYRFWPHWLGQDDGAQTVRPKNNFFFKKMGHSRPLFLLFSSFQHSWHSTNWATTTALPKNKVIRVINVLKLFGGNLGFPKIKEFYWFRNLQNNAF